MTEKIIFFDTTLRDGEQSSGFHMLLDEKLALARQLKKLNVEVIEAGFPASSPGDYRAVKRIATKIGTERGPIICSLARAVPEDIERAASAIKSAKKRRIHTFIATSDIHINKKLRRNKAWVTKQAVEAVKLAKSYTDNVEFSCEDFGRSDLDYIVDITCAAINAGATTINLPDTVGWMLPHEAYQRVNQTISAVRERGCDTTFSVHNHNDFGMATATTIESLRAGARQVEVTMNGIGERAGNTALEEIAAIIQEKHLPDFNFKHNINTKQIGPTSKLLTQITGIEPQPNKAIVGRNAFAHEAGIHQDGMIKERTTYETMDSRDYGVESVITFGPRSGRKALKTKYKELGIEVSEAEFEAAAKRFFKITDNKKESDDADIIQSIVGDRTIAPYFRLVSYNPVHNNSRFGSVIELQTNKKNQRHYAEGNGQIDALINGAREIIDRDDLRVADYRSISLGHGSDSQAYTKVIVTKNGWETKGYSTHPDTVTSAVQAFLEGASRMQYIEDNFK